MPEEEVNDADADEITSDSSINEIEADVAYDDEETTEEEEDLTDFADKLIGG